MNTNAATVKEELLDLYPMGKIPPKFHVPEKMWAWAIRRERHGRPNQAMA